MFKQQLDNFTHRDVLIHSPLRPDFYEWWPNFSDFELLSRAARHTLPIATQLSLRNVERLLQIDNVYGQKLIEHFRAPFLKQRGILSTIMNRSGISQPICDAINNIKREIFVANKYNRLSYLNASLPYSEGSWISMPGLVVLMLQQIIHLNIRTIIEVGAGCGYHLAVLKHVFKNANVKGFEANIDYASFGNEALKSCGLFNTEIVPEIFDYKLLANKNTLFIFTCVVPDNEIKCILPMLDKSSIAQIPHKTSLYYNIDQNFIQQIDQSTMHSISIFSRKHGNFDCELPFHDVNFVKYVTRVDHCNVAAKTPRLDNLAEIITES